MRQSLLLALLGAAGLQEPERPRPNIVLLLADDQRHDTIHALGNSEIVTPVLDALVRQGTAFTRAFIMGGDQPAVCIPSRAMLLTGRSLFRVGRSIPEDVPLLTEVFRRAGYVTFGVGKWHNGPRTYARGFAGGAEIFFGGMTDQSRARVHDFDPTGRYPRDSSRIGAKFSTELFTDAAVRFLEDYRSGAPFFLYVGYTSPHDPRTPPKPYADLYDPARIALPPNVLPEHPFDNGELRVRDETLAPWPRTPDVVRRHVADYYGMISHLDAQIGRILNALRRRSAAGNTLILFAGDNGLAVGQHGLMGKQNLYEHSIRVPLLLAGPGVPQGVRSDALCYLMDVFPTLCEAAGLAAPPDLDGMSLLPLLRGTKGHLRETLFFAYRDVQRAVRDERWKLIEYRVGNRRTTQLFDLEQDPWETTNRAEDPALAGHVERLRRELAGWQKRLGDPRAGWPP